MIAAQRSAVSRPATASRRSAVVVKASAESRRAVLGAFMGVAALSVSNMVEAATPIDVIDDRKARKAGYDLIYQAREDEKPISYRRGLDEARADLSAVKARLAKAEARIDTKLEPSIKKNYWTEAREELRRAVGDLRFDLNTLASAKPKEGKKAALEAKKAFIAQVEALDFALRQKNEASASEKLVSTKTALDAAIAAAV